ncbi:MAG TPA: GGDEF domain-containing protein [Thermoleophilaceae bacterium]|nr:GGDEF domain-containing protein [Thermoleophilaceae bacterium]
MDPLVELPGADDFEALLAREELRRARTGESLAVAMLDIDGLRRVNRHHGAGAGSEALRLCVATLRATLRAVDEIARTGPDEFAVLLHATDTRRASVWADRYEDALQEASAAHPAAPVTCSIGLADTIEEATLLQAAAKAHRRMEVIQTVRKLRRHRDGGAEATGPA